ncbi:hypothetical protein EA544_25460 [Salmonella enterica subsp. enterica serovar Poona]|nr:hypothetical protein [Salmonella enterica subsp. enterica serovar Poona]EAU5127847.1 hypothetical protein [Salmonella enterica subsp. enterica serovar Infantis]EDN0121222.1 hypothetical protein [Salmonella enterica]MMQ88174.1 hypothetical protein [Salmonella enterica subsp. enterica serovar Oranienburg]EAP4203462.1 hypothetical protein [Salmonella enterica subsp. enterica serovar Poona]
MQLDNVWHMPCRGDYVIRLDGTTFLQLWNSAGQLTRLQGDPLQMASWLQACHDAGFHRGIPGMVTKGRWLFYPQQKACSVTAPRFFMLSCITRPEQQKTKAG